MKLPIDLIAFAIGTAWLIGLVLDIRPLIEWSSIALVVCAWGFVVQFIYGGQGQPRPGGQPNTDTEFRELEARP